MEELQVGCHVIYANKRAIVRWMGWQTADGDIGDTCILLIQIQNLDKKYILDNDLVYVYLEEVDLKNAVPVFPESLGELLPPPLSFKDVKNQVRRNARVGLTYNKNSCYLDVSLMSMFAFTDAFDSLIPLPVLFPKTGDKNSFICLRVQALLRDIVRNLRTKLVVDRDATMPLRILLSTQKIQLKMRGEDWEKEENDPPTLLDFLIAKILKTHLTSVWAEETRTGFYSRGTRDIFFAYCDRPGSHLVTYQQYLEDTLRSERCLIQQFPERLVLQLPGRYEGTPVEDIVYAWPTMILDLTDLLFQGVHQCQLCGNCAEIKCEECRGLLSDDNISVYYCFRCCTSVHRAMDLNLWRNHMPMELEHKGEIGSVPQRFVMPLRAVLTIKSNHYTGFLRADDEKTIWRWLYYNDMGPKMIEVDMQAMVTSYAKSQIIETERDPIGVLENQLLCNGYVAFYDKPALVLM